MKKKFLMLTGVLILGLTLVGFWGYNNYFKPDPEIQQQLNNQFGEDFFSFSDTKKDVIHSGAANDVKSAGEKTDNAVIGQEKGTDQEKGKTLESAEPNNETVEKPITQEEITNKYEPKFNYLQNAALSRLDTLYSAAFQEYVQGKKAGNLNRSELIQKYFQAGTKLEASMDNQFYSLLNQMQAELTANNFPTDIVATYKLEYEKAKSDKRSQLLAKVRK